MKNSDSSRSQVEAKLDTLIKLMALSLTSDKSSLREKVVLLSRAGLTPKEIANLCDTTPNTVSVALSTAKASKGRTKSAS